MARILLPQQLVTELLDVAPRSTGDVFEHLAQMEETVADVRRQT